MKYKKDHIEKEIVFADKLVDRREKECEIYKWEKEI